MSKDRVLIVGGGVGGMSAAICLARTGRCEVDLIDLDQEWRALGAGLTLSGATLRALDRVGVLEQVADLGSTHTGPEVRDAQGKLLYPATQDRVFGARIPNTGGIMRPVLHKLLQDEVCARGVNVRLAVSFERVSQSGDVAEVDFTDGSSGRYDLVIGADGLTSSVRRTLFPEAPKPTFTGQGCWRAVFKRPADVKGSMLFSGAGRMAGLNPVSRDEMYMFLLQHVPDNRFMPPEQWPALLTEELKDFGGIIGDLRDGLGQSSMINYRPLEVIIMPKPWWKGRVLLIGDAAHATTPHAAFGAGLAVEDAVILGEMMQQGLSIPELLPAFVERRYERCKQVVERSVELGAMEVRSAPPHEHNARKNELVALIRAEP